MQATDLLTVNNEFTACLVLARCQTHENRRNHWKVRFDTSLLPDITVAVRLDHDNAAALDYYLLPSRQQDDVGECPMTGGFGVGPYPA
jgi:hypothetical protein